MRLQTGWAIPLNLNSARDAADRESGCGPEDEDDYRAPLCHEQLAARLYPAAARDMSDDDPVVTPNLVQSGWRKAQTMEPLLSNSLTAHEHIRDQLRRDFPAVGTLARTMMGALN
jgi:hypothetical protein